MPGSIEHLKYWKEGGRWDLWLNDVVLVRKFIKQYKLKPIARERVLERTRMMPTMAVETPVAMATRGIIPRIGYAGGMRAPHLHLDGDIFKLSQKQWNKFTRKALATMRERLAKVETIGFEQMMELSDSIGAVT